MLKEGEPQGSPFLWALFWYAAPMYHVHRLHYATVALSGKYNPPSFKDSRIDVFGYLLLSDNKAILVDTGIGEGNPYIDQTFKPERSDIALQLADFELTADDISIVINSHLHFDHCGNNRLFRSADIVIQESELNAAQAKFYTINQWFDYDGVKLRRVSGSREVAPDVSVLSTPGHTPGHQSIRVGTREGEVLIAAQAAFTADEYERGGDPEVQAHEGFETRYRKSLSELASLGAKRVLFSHDEKESAA